jgi:hypothetical protein
MPVSINNTTLTFNDATTQTTAGVTSVGAGTGISSSGGLTPTIANTGVTSIVAGTGISIDSGTGAVTVTNSNPNQLTTTTGSPAYYGARAWVSFNGSNGSIFASVNVGSVTRNGTGDYTVNFTTSMPDANYALSGAAKLSTFGNTDPGIVSFLRNTANPNLTGSARIQCANSLGNAEDAPIVTCVIHR